MLTTANWNRCKELYNHLLATETYANNNATTDKPQSEPGGKEMEKQEILQRLFETSVMRKAHEEMLSHLVAGMKQEYFGNFSPYMPPKTLEIPYFRNFVSMFLNSFMSAYAENIIEQIAEIVADGSRARQ